MSSVSAAVVEDLFREHRAFLWGLCYRMTGSAADADDLVQETFARVMERPPADTHAAWRPWLVRVAMNLGRDLLRRRRRRRYVGMWLPAPIETGEEESPPSFEPVLESGSTTEGRYEMLESVSYAFLLALEALTPQQRAVLLLRDVFDYSVQETAEALDLGEANVKTTHHRARRAMQAYDRRPCVPARALRQQTRRVLDQLVGCLARGDSDGLKALLAEDVRSLSDAAGEFFAARVPVVGRDKVARFYTNLAKRRGEGTRLEVRVLNGLPALITEFVDNLSGEAGRVVTTLELDEAGCIRAIHSILATRKLTAVRPIG